ncbi:MAG: hypothetical protein DMF78_02555 [Acidobacteria bacterium]|nr:MAG: hypothetical protein DMF78_02555 [Acidobacteriota bacterium]
MDDMSSQRTYSITACCESPGYRDRLDVSTDLPRGRHVLVVQLNPSTGNLARSDPTIGKVSIWACQNGFAKVTFVNLFAKRTPYPRDLARSYSAADQEREPHQDAKLLEAIADADVVVVAWGRVPARFRKSAHFRRRHRRLRELIGNRPVHAVGEPCRDGSPRHGRTWNGANRCLRTYDWANE